MRGELKTKSNISFNGEELTMVNKTVLPALASRSSSFIILVAAKESIDWTMMSRQIRHSDLGECKSEILGPLW